MDPSIFADKTYCSKCAFITSAGDGGKLERDSESRLRISTRWFAKFDLQTASLDKCKTQIIVGSIVRLSDMFRICQMRC